MKYSGFHIYNKKKKESSNEKDKLILELILEFKEGLELKQILELIENKINKKLETYEIEIAKEYPDYTEYQNKLKEKRMELTIKRRRIIDKLNSLLESGKIEKKGKKYFPSLSVLNDVYKFLPEGFSKSMIYSIGYFYPENVEKSLIEYINRFGFFLIYTFIEFSNIRHNDKEEYKKDFLYNWLQESIPINQMYDIFTDLYFYKEIDKEKIDKNKLLTKINSLLKKNYPDNYAMLTKIRHENIERLEESQKNEDQTAELMKKFEEQVDTKNFINKDTKVDPVVINSIDNKIYARVVPSDWYKQLSQLAKESD